MCGIAGYLSASATAVDSDVLSAMTEQITHRGPDSDGFWSNDAHGIAMGHRRLAIVDLSEAGAQPMMSACDRYCVVYNGELYNHLEIRRELQQAKLAPEWRGHSDTETLLAAVSAWGLDKAMTRLNGMYAIALWDKSEQQLHLIRDRFGEKPLYYGWVGRSFVFGSELRVLRQFPGWQGNLDASAIGYFLRYSTIPAPLSVYEGISKLEAGHCLRITRDGEREAPKCYWDPDVLALQAVDHSAPDEVLIDQLDELLATTVGARMMSDVPLGAFLSGGVDSSLVVAMMQRQSSTPVSTFSIGFEEASHDESPFARAVAKHLGTQHCEHIVSAQESLDVIPQITEIWDEPFADPSQIPTYLVSKLAREQVTVCLSGDGGDELFGGYRRYEKTRAIQQKLARYPTALRRLVGKGAGRLLPPVADLLASRGGRLAAFGLQADRLAALAELLDTRNEDELYEAMVALRSGPQPLMSTVGLQLQKRAVAISPAIEFPQRMMQHDLKHYLPEVILTKVDRAGMAVSLETRAPLLDPALAAFALPLPWSTKRHHGVGKWPLLSVLKRYVPAELVERPKMGFGVPIGSWLKGPLQPWAEDLLSEQSLSRSGLLDVAAIRRLWQQHKSGRFDWHHALWNVLILQSWLQRYH